VWIDELVVSYWACQGWRHVRGPACPDADARSLGVLENSRDG
jgi:hypothetical protein